jgi:hypothetical protein
MQQKLFCDSQHLHAIQEIQRLAVTWLPETQWVASKG